MNIRGRKKKTEQRFLAGLLIASVTASSGPIIRSPGFVPIIASAHSVFATFFELNWTGHCTREFSCFWQSVQTARLGI